MNRLQLLTAFLLANISVGAQGLQFMYKNQALEDGATVTIAAEEDIFGEISCETNPSTDPLNGLMLRCNPLSSGTVNADLEILSNTLNASSIQWCMGGECTLVRKNQLTKSFVSGENIQVLLDATNITGDGSFLAKLTVKLNGSTRMVYIQFVNGEDETSIRNPQSIIHNEATYDLSGRKMNAQSSLSQVQWKRIYVKNGKKYFKR